MNRHDPLSSQPTATVRLSVHAEGSILKQEALEAEGIFSVAFVELLKVEFSKKEVGARFPVTVRL
jgi:hypothetical protein